MIKPADHRCSSNGISGQAHCRPGLFMLLRIVGFFCSTLLLSWGVLVLIMLAIGGFTLAGLMLQLANLADRYIAADSARLASFHQILAFTHLGVIAVIAILRWHAIMPIALGKGNNRYG